MEGETIKEIAERTAHISNEVIEKDIRETEEEIRVMEAEAEHLAATPLSSKDARWNHMKADARKSGIKERQGFIANLQAILDYRKENNG